MAEHWASGQPTVMAVHSNALMNASGSSPFIIFWAFISWVGPIWLGDSAPGPPLFGIWVVVIWATWAYIF